MKCQGCEKQITDNTKSGNKKFCSKKCYQKTYWDKYINTDEGRFNVAKKSCSRTRHKDKIHRTWSLSLEEYTTLVKPNTCHYCTGPLERQGTALDRLDSTKGYEVGNVVPCCKNCNTLKGDFLTYTEAAELIGLLRKLRNGKVWTQ